MQLHFDHFPTFVVEKKTYAELQGNFILSFRLLVKSLKY